MSESLLLRRKDFPLISSPALDSTQNRVDGFVTRFVEEASDLKTLTSLTAGGLAYRFGKIGVFSLGEGRVATLPLRLLSVGLGLGSEVTAFELTSRTLNTIAGGKTPPLQNESPNFWNWSGPGGLKQSLINDLITFGMLKGAAFVSRESNLIFQHAFSSTAILAGHQTAAILGVIPKPEGPAADQLLQAEVTNLQLSAGTSLVHTTAPGITALERGLDLSLQSPFGAQGIPSLPAGPKWAWAVGASTKGLVVDPRHLEKNPNLHLMSGNNDDSSSDPDMTFIGTMPKAPKEEIKKPETFEELALSLGVATTSASGAVSPEKVRLALRSKVRDYTTEIWATHYLSKEHFHALKSFVAGATLSESSLISALKSLEEFLRLNHMLPSNPTPPPTVEETPKEAVPMGFVSDEVVRPKGPPKAPVLRLKELEELSQNHHILSESSLGNLHVSIRGKNNLKRQDLLDFYQLAFQQAREFRHFMETFPAGSQEFQFLEPRLQKLDRLLQEASTDLIVKDGAKSRPILEEAETQIDDLQKDLLGISPQKGAPSLLLDDKILLFSPLSPEAAKLSPSPKKDLLQSLFEDDFSPFPFSPSPIKPK